MVVEELKSQNYAGRVKPEIKPKQKDEALIPSLAKSQRFVFAFFYHNHSAFNATTKS